MNEIKGTTQFSLVYISNNSISANMYEKRYFIYAHSEKHPTSRTGEAR